MKEWFYYKEAYEKPNKPMAQQTAVVKIINSRIYYLGVYGDLFTDITEQWIKFQFK